MILLRPLLFSVLFISAAMSFGNDLAEQNRHRIMELQRIVMEQNERIDGLTSLIEGMNAQIAELKMATSHRSGRDENNETVALIRDLGKMIDEINRNYVSKKELQAALASGKAVSSDKTSSASKGEKGKDASLLSQATPAKLYSEGVRLFVKKRYDEAKKHFLLTAKKGYKPAASNYYLGEIAYYTKQYADAIFYYKKSAGLYDQASYMDVLLLHTAVSLEKRGEKEQAKRFYENVIESYQGRKSASIAKKRLKGI
ncbi:MAG: tetratricopeptide repeat protein [Sulfurovum sp.]|nr:tetratricopeptide repeat protein [Sulfurovum sp.]